MLSKGNGKAAVLLVCVIMFAVVVGYLAQQYGEDGASAAGQNQLQVDGELPVKSSDVSPGQEDVDTEVEGVVTADIQHSSPVGEDDGLNLIREDVRQVYSARSAGDMIDQLRALSEITPEYAARKADELDDFCDKERISAAEAVGTSDELMAARKAYCEGYEASSVEELKRDLSILQEPAGEIDRIARDPYLGPQEEFRSRIESADESERADVFTQMVRGASNPDQLVELISLNQSHASSNGGVPLWRLGINLLELHPQADLLNAQKTAILLYSCQTFGGCGPNQYFRLVLCSVNFLKTCPPGASVEENLYQTTPPADFDLANGILARL